MTDREKLIELFYKLENRLALANATMGKVAIKYDEVADYLIAHGVTVQPLLTVAEKADLERIRISIERKCRDMAQPGMWERYTKHMECGEVRELAQYYRDMELVYKLITGCELPWPPKECE